MTESLADSYTCQDGTAFAVHSSHVRGEPRYYWVEHHLMDGHPSHGTDFEGSYTKRKAQRAARRLAKAHDASL